MILLTQKSRQKKSASKKSEGSSAKDILLGLSACLTDYVICLYILIMTVIFPFYFTKGYAHIGTDKSVFFRRVSMYAGIAFLVPILFYLLFGAFSLVSSRRMSFGGKLRLFLSRISLTDWFAGLYGLSLLLSFFFSEYRESALWGAVKWYMGFVPQLILVAVYLLISKFWKPRKWMFLLLLPVSLVVFVLGVLNRFGIYLIEMAGASPSFISTIGNINWYCGYTVCVVFVGIVLYWYSGQEETWKKIVLLLYSAIGFATLVTQGSESGLVTLVVIMVTMFCFSVTEEKRMIRFWEEMLLLWGGCSVITFLRFLFPESMNYPGGFVDWLTYSVLPLIMMIVSVFFYVLLKKDLKKGVYRKKLFLILARIIVVSIVLFLFVYVALLWINKVSPGAIGPLSDSSLFVLDAAWGSYRGATWSAGWRCFADQNVLHKLVGVGPDCMVEYIYSGANQDLLAAMKESFGEAKLTNAHNEWLTILVNMGILGCVGYAGMIVTAVLRFIRKGKESPILIACAFSLLGYSINNVFSFQQSMNAGTIFVIFGMGMAFLREEWGGKR